MQILYTTYFITSLLYIKKTQAHIIFASTLQTRWMRFRSFAGGRMSCDDGHAVGPQTVNLRFPLSRRPPVAFFFFTFFFLRYATFLSCRLLFVVPLVSHLVAFFSNTSLTLFSPTYISRA